MRRAVQWLATAAAYLFLRRAAVHAGWVIDDVPLMVPGLGVGVAAVQLGGPWLASAFLVAGIVEGVIEGLPPLAALLFGATVAGAAITYAAIRPARLWRQGERAADTLVRIGAAFVAAVVGGSLYFATLAVAGGSRAPALWGVLVLAAFAGIVTVSPFARSWALRISPGVAGRLEWIALFAVTVGASVLVFGGFITSKVPTAYLLFPIVVWAAVRTGRMGVSAVTLIVAFAATGATAHGRGPFVDGDPKTAAVMLCTFIVVLASTGLILVGLDLERRFTASTASEARRRHRRLVDQLPLVTYVRTLDPNEPPTFIGPQIVDLVGYPLESWTTDPEYAEKIVHDEDRAEFLAFKARSLSEEAVVGEYRFVAADGSVVWVLDHMVAIHDEAGKLVGRQGFLVDITDRKQLEDQLVRAQRIEALGLLAGGVAHDFNNLLTAISGYTQLALEQVGDSNDVVRTQLGEVQSAANGAAALTRRLLAFARQQVLDRTVLDLNDVVADGRAVLDGVVGERITLVTELGDGVPRVRVDRGQLVQVLLTLATNARDAMPYGGTLTIRTAVSSGEALLSVSDTGVGMDEETRARIFEPFFTTKEVGEGTGLGLAMVHGIVQQSGGRLEVESQPGQGSTFTVALPATDEEPAHSYAASTNGNHETVLLVDDEDIVRRLTAEMLERQGYQVLSVGSAKDALELDEPWDILLTDVVMPKMTGPELAAHLAPLHPCAAILFMSGYTGGAAADREAFGADLLEKPFTLDELTRKVRAALDARCAR